MGPLNAALGVLWVNGVLCCSGGIITVAWIGSGIPCLAKHLSLTTLLSLGET